MKNKRRNFLQTLGMGAVATIVSPVEVWAESSSDLQQSINLFKPEDNSEAFWETIKSQFRFAKGLTYFNNGSLGACPTMIRKATTEFRDTLDDFPSKYMWGGWSEEKEIVRKKTAALFSVSEEEIALIHNTTEGMNIIARSLALKEGDEIILDNHEHASAVSPWKVWQESNGVKFVRPVLPILPESVEELVDVFRKAITPKTKIISVCHLVNTNGMKLPIKEITKMAHEKGILVAVDGAQAAGMIRFDLKDVDCDFYTVSAHKWLFSPKEVGIFYAKKESQKYLKPLMVARGYNDTSIRRLENYNTRNLPNVLGFGAALDYHETIGSKKIEARTFALKNYLRSAVEMNPKLMMKTPALDSLSAGIQVVEVLGKDVKNVKNRLFEAYGIDCRPMSSFGLNAARFSLAVFITKKDIDNLVNALGTIANS